MNIKKLTFACLVTAGIAHGADLAFLRELVEIPSSSIDYPQVNRAMRAMKSYLDARGLFCTVETDDSIDVVTRYLTSFLAAEYEVR